VSCNLLSKILMWFLVGWLHLASYLLQIKLIPKNKQNDAIKPCDSLKSTNTFLRNYSGGGVKFCSNYKYGLKYL